MQDDLINIAKLKSIFAEATGERTIEVTEDEYQSLLKEAKKSALPVKELDDTFLLTLGDLNIKITCEYEEDFDDELDEDDL